MTKIKKAGLTVVGWVMFGLNTLLVGLPAFVLGWLGVIASILSAGAMIIARGFVCLHDRIDKARKRITTIDIG